MRRVLTLLSLLAITTTVYAEEAVITRNAHLRVGPAKTTQSLRVLMKNDEVDVLDPTPTDGYVRVQTEDGTEGWVWAKFVRTPPPAETVLPAAQPASEATSIDLSWERPDPVTGTFTLSGKTCGPTGSGDKRDKETNRRKNRTDIPTTYHDVTWKTIADLDYPTPAPKSRENFTDEQLAEIAKYEGVAVTTVGYVVAIKPQANNTESCNCSWKGEKATDWHIALVQTPGDGEKTSIVVEPTPRIKKKHPNWTKKRLEPWLNQDQPVRISGWLLFDPQHTNHLKKYRSTLWEIHPITKIEVWNNDTQTWDNLDNITDEN